MRPPMKPPIKVHTWRDFPGDELSVQLTDSAGEFIADLRVWGTTAEAEAIAVANADRIVLAVNSLRPVGAEIPETSPITALEKQVNDLAWLLRALTEKANKITTDINDVKRRLG